MNDPDFATKAPTELSTFAPGAALLTKKDLAARLRLTPRTIENWQREGLPHFKLGQRRVRFDWEEVRRWLNDHCRVERAA